MTKKLATKSTSTASTMAQDGLRYVAKKAGSPFTASRTGIGATMSLRRPRATK